MTAYSQAMIQMRARLAQIAAASRTREAKLTRALLVFRNDHSESCTCCDCVMRRMQQGVG